MNALPDALDGFVQVVRHDRFWMTWNLILAAVPAVIAPFVFRSRGTRTFGWWAGVVVVALFLPNAPYVVTDLVHLRGDVVLAGNDVAVIAGVLPLYLGFIGAGFAAYTFVLAEAGRYLTSVGLRRWLPATELAVHSVCAVGVMLGRVARLNSWEPVTRPHGTLERVVLTLSWRWAPVAVVATFVVIWAGHALTRLVARSLAVALERPRRALRSAVERRPGPGVA